MAIIPSDAFQYYTDAVYWNDFDAVRKNTNRLISGDETRDWIAVLMAHGGSANRVYVPNCGNGWVERELIARGAAASAIGTDISAGLLEEARRGAAAASAPADYRVMDCNDLRLEQIDFDRVVNYAAFHHIAYLDRALREMLIAMPTDGLMVCFDYTGPHRNQYDWELWDAVVRFNETLPQRYRANLIYPHQKTMIHMDPTEAIHSELILDHCAAISSLS